MNAGKEAPRLALTAFIILFFGYALFSHYSEGLEETLKNVTMLAVGFWLGSSKGSSDKDEQLAAMTSDPQVVTIDQPPDKRVPVEEG